MEEDTNTTVDKPSRKHSQSGDPERGWTTNSTDAMTMTQANDELTISKAGESICGNVRICMALVSTAR